NSAATDPGWGPWSPGRRCGIKIVSSTSGVLNETTDLTAERSAFSTSSGGSLKDNGPSRQSYQPCVFPGANSSVTGTLSILRPFRESMYCHQMCGHQQKPAPAAAASTQTVTTTCRF